MAWRNTSLAIFRMRKRDYVLSKTEHSEICKLSDHYLYSKEMAHINGLAERKKAQM